MESKIINPITPAISTDNLSPRQSIRLVEPRRQQWAVIYNQQAQQFKRQKQIQKVINKQRRDQFKQQLDQQLYSKSSLYQHEKQQDKKYSQYIKSKVSQQNQIQKNEKLKKLLQRRRIQQQNFNRIGTVKNNSKQKQHYAVGLYFNDKSDVQRKQQYHNKKKSLSDALDRQLQMKQAQKRIQKLTQQYKNSANMQYLNNYYNKRESIQPRKRQNADVYNYFQKLNQQKLMKDKQLQKKLVDQVIAQKKIQQMKKQQYLKKQKQQHERQTRSILEQQMKYKSVQSLNEKKYNPQQNSYQIIGGIFKDKKSNYDKKQYFQYLSRQAEEQSRRKKKWDFMNQEQYKLNMNQLNKAVTGRYEDGYIDRTLNMIGNRTRGISAASLDLGTTKANKQQDLIAVKTKIEELKKHKNSNQNQMQNSSFRQ